MKSPGTPPKTMTPCCLPVSARGFPHFPLLLQIGDQRLGIFIFRQSLQSIITGRLSLLEDGGFAAYHRIGTRRDGDAPGLPVGELQRGFTGNVFDGQQHFGGCSSSVCPPMPAHTFDREELWPPSRSEEHTSELQSLMRSSYAVFC